MASNFVNPLLDIKYDLIHDVIEGEPTPSLTHFALSRLVVSLWQKNIVDNIKRTPNLDFKHIFQDIDRCKIWFQKIENQILNGSQKGVKNCVTFAEMHLPQIFYREFQELVSKIKKNISYFFHSFGNLNVPLTIEIIEIYVRSIQITMQGTINFQRTASYVVENLNLSSINKYAISCYYCLNEKICELLIEMPDNFISYFQKNVKENFQIIAHMTYKNLLCEKEKYKLHPIYRHENSEFSLLFTSFLFGHDVAVQFFLENCPENERTNSLTVLFKTSDSVNVWCYFISRMNSLEDIESFCKFDGYRLLIMLGSDSRWSSYFLASSLYVLTYLNEMNERTAIKTIIVCWLYNISYRDYYYKLLVEYCFNTIKISLGKFIFSSETILLIILAINLEFVGLRTYNIQKLFDSFFSLRSNNDIKKLFDNDEFLLDLVYELLKSEKLYLLKDLIKELYTESIAEVFMHRLVIKISVKFCSKYLDYEFEKIADRLFIYCEMRRFNDYKSELPFKEDGKIIGDILKRKKSEKLQHINDFLNWCFDGDEERVLNCKINLFNLEDHPNRYCNIQLVNQLKILIKEKYYQQTKVYLKWAGISEKYLNKFLYAKQ